MQIEVLETNNFDTGVQLATETVMTLRIDGYPVPYIRVLEYPENPDIVSMVVDNRMAYDIPRELLATVGRLVADSMALASGRTSFGANSNIKNLYGEPLAGYITQDHHGTPVVDEGFEG